MLTPQSRMLWQAVHARTCLPCGAKWHHQRSTEPAGQQRFFCPWSQPTPEQPLPMPPHAQVVIGLGLLAATGYAIKEFLAPRVAHWLADGRARTSAAEAERKKDAAAVAAAIAAQVRCLSLDQSRGVCLPLACRPGF